jgi:ribonuclease HI
MTDRLQIWCDGACRNNQSKTNLGSYACILKYGDKEKSFGEVVEDTTNNKMELGAAILALSKVKNKSIPTEVTTDSQYVVMGITDWSKKWIENGWKNAKNKPIENQDLWRWLLDLVSKFDDIKFISCLGHKDNEYNNKVDDMCNQLMNEYLLNKPKGTYSNASTKKK